MMLKSRSSLGSSPVAISKSITPTEKMSDANLNDSSGARYSGLSLGCTNGSCVAGASASHALWNPMMRRSPASVIAMFLGCELGGRGRQQKRTPPARPPAALHAARRAHLESEMDDANTVKISDAARELS